MYVALNPVLLLLLALLATLLVAALLKWASVRGWLLLGALVLVCAGTNPDKTDHTGAVQRSARTQLARGASAPGNPGLTTDLKDGRFEPRAAYHDLAIGSVVVLDGEILSFGVLGQVWVTNLKHLAHSKRQ